MTDEREINLDAALDFDIPEELVPPGVYVAQAEHAEVRQGPKVPYINVRFMLLEGPAEGMNLFYRIFPIGELFARNRAKAELGALLGREIKAKGETLGGFLQEIPGKSCRIEVVRGEYQGEARPEIKRLFPMTGSGEDLDSVFAGTSKKK